ncbi:Dinoflagellate/viral nucleoprotein (DVNP) [Amphidinium carterae]|mmetsp:Transcript_48884/g.109656  ORF Transcript_48884/g.109656 Transcript_48884/m.109656 type:complete len:95 (+) Transcript_48884:49-333(+)
MAPKKVGKKASVFKGTKEKTSGGLTKSKLTKNKRGKVVSKAASAQGKKAYNHIKKWAEALKKARKELGIKGFVPIGGKTKAGKDLLAKVKEILG